MKISSNCETRPLKFLFSRTDPIYMEFYLLLPFNYWLIYNTRLLIMSELYKMVLIVLDTGRGSREANEVSLNSQRSKSKTKNQTFHLGHNKKRSLYYDCYVIFGLPKFFFLFFSLFFNFYLLLLKRKDILIVIYMNR